MNTVKRVPALSLAVVGAQHYNSDGSDRRFEILLCKPGEPVELRPEPKNKHDELAVAVFSCRAVQIGYLTAERCGRIGSLIREGRQVRALFQGKAQFGAWIRVAFDGEVPVLAEPPSVNLEDRPSDAADFDSGFYPDEDYDEIFDDS